MTTPSLARLDLNLLVALDALLAEASVTRAAHRLQLSQPAVSAQLARLRAHFQDLLLIRRGNNYVLTTLAVRLADDVGLALDAARRVFEGPRTADPAEISREFVVYGSDYGIATVGSVALRLLADRAPRARLRFLTTNTPVVDEAPGSLRGVDGLLLPHGQLSDVPHSDLVRDRWCVLASTDNPLVADGLTTKTLESARWALTHHSHTTLTDGARHLMREGIDPAVDCVVESFLALPFLVRETTRLALIQESLAEYAESMAGLRVLPLPFPAPLTLALWWHPALGGDPQHAWMRDLFTEAGALAGSRGRADRHLAIIDGGDDVIVKAERPGSDPATRLAEIAH